MQFKKDVHFSSDDFYYDLFEGGYIKPENLLENPDEIVKVKQAISVIEQFRDELEVKGIMEES